MKSGRIANALWMLLLATPVWAQQSPEAYFPPFQDAEARALQLLDAAQVSVDVAQYNIRNERFFTQLKALKARGVRVRIVVDAKNAAQPWNTLDDTFQAEGFDIIRYRNTRSSYAIMHHKFTVIDGALVMTGSYNWNQTAQVVNDENMLVLRDPALVAAYQAEFAELRGAPEVAGAGVGHSAKVYFAPEDRPRDAVLAAIRGAQQRILVAMFAFKDTTVARALRDAARRGVSVILLTEKKQADTTRADETVASGGARVIVGANTSSAYSAMHHKFAVVDDHTVIGGACNWTYTAFNASNEDLLVIRDAALARKFTVAFGALVRRYDAANFRAAEFGIARTDAGAHFVVAMPRTQPGDTVVVTGDHPALGSWDPARGLVLRTSGSIFPSWAGAVRLPAGMRVAWKAVVRRKDGSATWELGGNRTLTTDGSGTDGVTTASFRDVVEVELKVRHANLPAGAELRLVGADTGLGSWDPTLGIPLAEVAGQSGTFTVKIPLPGRARLACKLVAVQPDGTVRWERGLNRTLAVHGQDAPQKADLASFRE